MTVFSNGYFLSPKGKFERADILVDDGIIKEVRPSINYTDGCKVIDLDGKKIIPGFIDIHIHGSLGYDVMTASPKQLVEISKYLAKEGTTTFLPTTITADMDDIVGAISNIRQAYEILSEDNGANIAGVHIEGPYINPKRKGCHDVSKMRYSDIEEYKAIKTMGNDTNLKFHYTIAPELPNSYEFIDRVLFEGDTISIGHSDADYETINKALNQGVNIFTHMFNGMRGLHHREPGVVGAALLSDAFVELICDGVHVYKDNVKLAYKLKGKDRIILVSDAMQAKGLGDGTYEFGGFNINVINGIARKEDGQLASSTLSIHKAIQNISEFADIPIEYAIQMATINPARAIGIDNITGSIEVGKRADLVIVDNDFNIEMVYAKGRKIE